MEADSSLKQQFQLLQEKQQKRLLRRKQELESKEKSSLPSANTPNTFGVDDDLNLKLAGPPPKTSSYLSDELVQHLNDQIRELKDENSRVYKLLSERDFEIRQLRKRAENDKEALSGNCKAITNETAALKIVELSKKIRETTAELESEKTKSRQLGKKCHDQQQQLSAVPPDVKSRMKADINPGNAKEDKPEVDVKALQDKLKQTDAKMADFRNQCASLKQELKVAHKIVCLEVGETTNIQSLLSGTSNWRGRTQQILALQKKVEDLKYELGNLRNPSGDGTDRESATLGNYSARQGTSDLKHREQLRKMEKERKENQEKAVADMKALEEENSSVKDKLDAARVRNKVLSNEVKSHKEQMKTLLQKGQHDDELIQALMKQQSTLQNMLETSTKFQSESKQMQDDKLKELSMKTQQDTNIVERLKAIVSEKEGKVHHLEEEIRQLKLQHLQRAQKESTDRLFQPVMGRLPASTTSTPDCVDVNFTISSVSPPNSRSSNRPATAGSQNKSRTGTPLKSNNLEKQTFVHLQHECEEHRMLQQVAEVERDKLMELVQVIQKRLDDSSQQFSESQNELVHQRRKNAELEKQIAKSRLDQTSNSKGSATARKKGASVGSSLASIKSSSQDVSNQNEDDLEHVSLPELLTRLDILQDENEAVKRALQSTLKSKEEDLKVYTEMMEETKQIFLQALRQSRSNVQTAS